MSEMTGREIRLKHYPSGNAVPEDFDVADGVAPPPQDGEVRVRVECVSVDPMIRILIDAHPLGGALPPLPLGAVPPGAAIGKVIDSRHENFSPGDLVEGRLGWRECATVDGRSLNRIGRPDLPASAALGVLGLPGFTAYIGLRLLDALQAGDRLLISGATGAVGSVLGPLARLRGVDVTGIAGGEARCRALVDQFGYDRAVDRKSPNFLADLKTAAGPSGFSAYFDNVGGEFFVRVLPLIKFGGQAIVCGLMAQYGGGGGNAEDKLPAALEAVMSRQLTIRGFANIQYAHLRPQFLREVGDLVKSGRLPTPEHYLDGIENVPVAFCRLFTDGVVGKSLVRLAASGGGAESVIA